MQCAFCGRRIEAKSAWKGARSRFYCSEFCADSEIANQGGAAAAPVTATLLERHVRRPYERLERLLPYMRAYSGRALAARRAQSPA
jgi:hypothetical protein